jgi:hypothetical protein
MLDTVTRNASLQDLAALLKEQHARKIDVVAPAKGLRLDEGNLVLKGIDPVLDDDGVTDPNGEYRPTAVFDEGLADKLQIPLQYVRRLRATRPDLMDVNVNGLLHGRRPKVGYPNREESERLGIPSGEQYEKRPGIPGDDRKFLVRLFRGDDDTLGYARALLSDGYRVIDNLDVLTSALDGVRQAGTDVVIQNCDLSERRMVIHLVAPEIQVLAERLLKGYRNPFGDDFERWRRMADREGLGYGGEEPIVFAGLRLSNSETGDGAFSIAPEVQIKVCANGLVIRKDVVRSVHAGGKLEEGLIRWSDETQKKSLELVSAKTADAVRTFLDVDYVTATVEALADAGEKPVDKPQDEIKVISKRLQFSQESTDGILEHFIRGGQMNRAGVMNAITSYAQTVESPETAYDLSNKAVEALTV